MKPTDKKTSEKQVTSEDSSQGKRLENPSQRSEDLSNDIGSRKDKEYPGADDALTGQRAEQKQGTPNKGFNDRGTSNDNRNQQGKTQDSKFNQDQSSSTNSSSKTPDRNKR